LQHRPRLLSDSDTEVVELSEVLNALPIHAVRPDAEKFRNPNGVAMKLANFAALDPQYPGAGLRAGGKEDRETWDLFYDRPDDLAMLAGALRRWASKGDAPAAPEEGEDEAEEGRIAYRQHRVRERDHSLGKKKKAAALRSNGRLACEVCGFDFSLKYGDIGEGYMEAHHVVALSEIVGTTTTKLGDLALVCSNCHRMLHRGSTWLRPDELRARLARQSNA
jgi:5-methylcytosine-specific restriction protein A